MYLDNIEIEPIVTSTVHTFSGEDMKKTANENLTVLFNANPSSVGGELPKDDFWYNAK